MSRSSATLSGEYPFIPHPLRLKILSYLSSSDFYYFLNSFTHHYFNDFFLWDDAQWRAAAQKSITPDSNFKEVLIKKLENALVCYNSGNEYYVTIDPVFMRLVVTGDIKSLSTYQISYGLCLYRNAASQNFYVLEESENFLRSAPSAHFWTFISAQELDAKTAIIESKDLFCVINDTEKTQAQFIGINPLINRVFNRSDKVIESLLLLQWFKDLLALVDIEKIIKNFTTMPLQILQENNWSRYRSFEPTMSILPTNIESVANLPNGDLFYIYSNSHFDAFSRSKMYRLFIRSQSDPAQSAHYHMTSYGRYFMIHHHPEYLFCIADRDGNFSVVTSNSIISLTCSKITSQNCYEFNAQLQNYPNPLMDKTISKDTPKHILELLKPHSESLIMLGSPVVDRVLFKDLFVLDAKNAKYYNTRGTTSLACGRVAEAIEGSTIASRIDPNNLQAYEYRGICYESMQKFNSAREDFLKGLVLDQQDPKFYILLIRLYSLKLKDKEVIKILTLYILIMESKLLNLNNRKDSRKFSQLLIQSQKPLGLSQTKILRKFQEHCRTSFNPLDVKNDDDLKKFVTMLEFYYQRGVLYVKAKQFKEAKADFLRIKSEARYYSHLECHQNACAELKSLGKVMMFSASGSSAITSSAADSPAITRMTP